MMASPLLPEVVPTVAGEEVVAAGSDVAVGCRSGWSSGGYQFPSDANHHPSLLPIVATFVSTFHHTGYPYPVGRRRAEQAPLTAITAPLRHRPV